MKTLVTVMAWTMSLGGAAFAWTGFTPGPEYQPTICFISPQEGTTIAINDMEPDTETTAGGKALVLTHVQAPAFPPGAQPVADAEKRIRAAASIAHIELAKSVAVIIDKSQRGNTGDWSVSVAIPISGTVEGTPALSNGVVVQDVAPRKVVEMRYSGTRTEIGTSLGKMHDFIAGKSLTEGPMLMYEFYSGDDLVKTDPTTIEVCQELK